MRGHRLQCLSGAPPTLLRFPAVCISGVTSPAAGPGCWCSSRSPVGRSRMWTGCTTGSLHSTLYNTPFACGPAHTHTYTFKLLVLTLTTTQNILSTLFASSPFCCCVEVWPASLRSCQTVGPVDCHVAERWSSGWRRHLFWKIRSRSDLNLGQVLVRLLSKLSCTPAVWSLILQYFTFSLFWNIIQHCVYINISSTNWLWQDFTFQFHMQELWATFC